MRRFASLDFIRGILIMIMIMMHVPMRWYDRGWVEGSGELRISGLTLMFFGLMIFFGAWAGLFLLVSSIVNMISIQRNLEKGISPMRIVMFQVIGGLLLLTFAMVVESTIGYHGYLGEIALGNSDRWDMMIWRIFHMETIHTIAASMIVTGIVMGILTMHGGAKKTKRNIIVLAILAILSIVLTLPAWELARWSYSGYPFGMRFSDLLGRDIAVQYPIIGESPFIDVIYRGFLMFIAGAPEPIFPYLALSFVGCIIGICMCKGRSMARMPRYMMIIGSIASIIGLIGTAFVIISGKETYSTLMDRTYELPGLYPNLWLWWFLLIGGFELFATALIVRSVEYRGIGKRFGKATFIIRRYGLVAFSVYAFQTVDLFPRLIFTLFPDLNDTYPFPSKVSALMVLMMIPMTMLLWEVVLRAWQRIGFAGGLEWWMAKITERLFPDKRSNDGKREKRAWWRVKRLDPSEYLTGPQWIDVIESSEMDHRHEVDSRFSFYLSLGGALIPPLSVLAIFISNSAKKTEGKNSYNVIGLWWSIICLCAWVLTCGALTQVHLDF